MPELRAGSGIALTQDVGAGTLEVALANAADVYLSSYITGTDEERFVAAYNATPEGGRLILDADTESSISTLLTVGNGGDVATAKNITIVWDRHRFKFTADGARLQFCGPISDVLVLSTSYVKGSRTLVVAHTGTQLSAFVRGRKLKIVSNALDGWNRNQGTQTSQYRLAEWAIIRDVEDNLDGTATITLWAPLKFTRGFTNTGDAENLTEGDTYTTANNARVFVVTTTMSFEGQPEFYVEDAASHIGAGGWSDDPLIEVMGFDRPHLDRFTFDDTIGQALALYGCYDPQVKAPLAKGRLPDLSEQSANDGLTTTNYGYLCTLAGCWLGSVVDAGGGDTRHVITENGTTAVADTSTYSTLLAMGRTAHTTVISSRGGGQYSAPIDTHHGAHAWTFIALGCDGTQFGPALNLRGPGHRVIGGAFRGEKGISVISEWASAGGTDLPALNGNGDEWTSSATLVAVDIDATQKALLAQAATIYIESGCNIRCASHHALAPEGGRIIFASGKSKVKITGDAQAATLNGDTTQRGIMQATDVAAEYGTLSTPGIFVERGASLEIDATAAVDGVSMNVAGQSGTTAKVSVEGELYVTVPASGFNAAAFANSIYREIGDEAVLSLTGMASMEAAFPVWDCGKVRLANLVQGTAQKLFTFYDGLGGLSGFYATVEIIVVDHTAIAGEEALFQVNDLFSASSTSEGTYLLRGDTGLFEAAVNVNLSSTAPTAGRVALSLRDGIVWIRSEVAGTYEDVFAKFTIHRQPVKA